MLTSSLDALHARLAREKAHLVIRIKVIPCLANHTVIWTDTCARGTRRVTWLAQTGVLVHDVSIEASIEAFLVISIVEPALDARGALFSAGTCQTLVLALLAS